MAERGLARCDPEACEDGYTLFSNTGGDTAYLIDMAGRVVHTWSLKRTDLQELLPNGHLLYGTNYYGVEEVDWQGRPQWFYPCTWHHDFALSGDGRLMLLCGGGEKVFDRPDIFEGCREGLAFTPNYFLEIDLAGFARTWQWWAHEHVEELSALVKFPRAIDIRSKGRWGDIFHCNTLEVLPDSGLGRRDERFRAGNVLFSFRQMDVIGVVDRRSGSIAWAWGPGELDGQHMPTLIPDSDPFSGRPMPGAGRMLVFDNGYLRRDFTRVIELDPTSNRIVWTSPTDWRSWHISGAQRLPNGNTFICDGPAGRLFEITRAGRTVWEYRVPFRKARPPGELGTKAAHGDSGGQDSAYALYRATRYPKQYVDGVLRRND